MYAGNVPQNSITDNLKKKRFFLSVIVYVMYICINNNISKCVHYISYMKDIVKKILNNIMTYINRSSIL